MNTVEYNNISCYCNFNYRCSHTLIGLLVVCRSVTGAPWWSDITRTTSPVEGLLMATMPAEHPEMIT